MTSGGVAVPEGSSTQHGTSENTPEPIGNARPYQQRAAVNERRSRLVDIAWDNGGCRVPERPRGLPRLAAGSKWGNVRTGIPPGWVAIVLASGLVFSCVSSPGPWRDRTGDSLSLTWSPTDAPPGSLLVIAQEPVDFSQEVRDFTIEKIEPRIGDDLTLEGAGVLNMKGYGLGGFDEIYTAAGEPAHEREGPLPGLADIIPLGTTIRPEEDDRFVLVLLVRVEGSGEDASVTTYDVIYTADGVRHRAHVPTNVYVRVDDEGR